MMYDNNDNTKITYLLLDDGLSCFPSNVFSFHLKSNNMKSNINWIMKNQ